VKEAQCLTKIFFLATPFYIALFFDILYLLVQIIGMLKIDQIPFETVRL